MTPITKRAEGAHLEIMHTFRGKLHLFSLNPTLKVDVTIRIIRKHPKSRETREYSAGELGATQ